MQDRFKFRVWDKERKCFFNDDEVVIYPNGEESFFNADYDFTECVVEQCSGLRDKNGKLIYEGDIVYSPFDNGTKKVIFWDNYLASFMAYNRYPDKRYYQGLSSKYFIELEFEVVGNIHENPELLEGE